MGWGSGWAVVVAVVGGASAPLGAAGGWPSDPFRYALFAENEVVLGEAAQVEGGDVGCNLERGRVRLAARARVAGVVAADTVFLGRNSRAAGVFCKTLENDVTNPCGALTTPLVDAARLPIVQVVAGSEPVRLRARSQTTLQPGKYDAVRIGSKSILTLAGGTYSLRSLTVGRSARVQCAGKCIIGVDDAVVLDEGATLTTKGSADPTAIRVDVELGGSGRAAFRASARSRVDATVYAPLGRIRLGTNGRFTGAFVGSSIEVLQRARVLSAPAT